MGTMICDCRCLAFILISTFDGFVINVGGDALNKLDMYGDRKVDLYLRLINDDGML